MEYANFKKNDELIIDLKNLFWRILEQWKAIVVFGVIIALIFSGFMYLRISSRVEEEAVVRTPAEILDELSPEDQEAVTGAFTLREARDKVQKYISDSPLMSLDPFNVNSVTATWIISSEQGINKQLLAAYVNEMSSYEMADSVNKAWGNKYETDAARELLSAKADIPLETGADLESNLLKLTIYLPEGNDADAAIKAVKSLLPGVTEKLSGSIGTHSISEVSVDVQVISDTGLSDIQYNVHNRLYNLNYDLNYLMKNVLTSDQKAAYEALAAYDESEEETEEAAEPEQKSKPKFINKKRLLIGFVLGAIMYCGLYLLYFVFSGKAVSPKVLEETYGLRTLGEWHSEKKGDMLTFLMNSKFFYGLHHKGHTHMDKEVERIARSVENALDGRGEKQFLLISSSRSSESAETLISALRKRLTDAGIVSDVAETDPSNGIYLGEDVLKSGEAVALIVDQKNTGLKDVKDVCEKCIVCGIPFVGVAYVE